MGKDWFKWYTQNNTRLLREVPCTRQGGGMGGPLKNHSSFFTSSSILANNSPLLHCHLLSLHTYPWHIEVRRLLSCLQAPAVFTHLTSLYKYVLIPTKWLKSRSIFLLSFSTKILTLTSVVTIIEQLTWRKLIFFLTEKCYYLGCLRLSCGSTSGDFTGYL